MKFLLPGWGEIEADDLGTGPNDTRRYRLTDAPHIIIHAPLDRPLTPVAPPLPEQPPVWSVVSCYDGEMPWTFQREPVDDKHFWFTTGQERGFSWAEVCSKGRPVLLTPEPAKVELPWSGLGFYVEAADKDGHVWVRADHAEGAYHSREAIREMAAALWTAAGEP